MGNLQMGSNNNLCWAALLLVIIILQAATCAQVNYIPSASCASPAGIYSLLLLTFLLISLLQHSAFSSHHSFQPHLSPHILTINSSYKNNTIHSCNTRYAYSHYVYLCEATSHLFSLYSHSMLLFMLFILFLCPTPYLSSSLCFLTLLSSLSLLSPHPPSSYHFIYHYFRM